MIDLPMFKLVNRFAKRLDHNWYIEDCGVSYSDVYYLKCDEVGTISFKLRYVMGVRNGELVLEHYYGTAEVVERNPSYKLPMVTMKIGKTALRLWKEIKFYPLLLAAN